MALLLPSRLWLTKKHLILAGGILSIIIGVVLYFLLRPDTDTTTPSYQTVLPHNRSVEDLGGWQRISPPDKEPVFAFSDTVDGVAINVSQQPLPASFAGDVGRQVEQLAKSYNATTSIDADGTAVYIGRSARGPQSVIFTRDGLLVMIKSQGVIAQESWVRYITALANPHRDTTPTF